MDKFKSAESWMMKQDFLETIVKRLKARKIEATGVDSGYKALEFLDNMTLM